MDFEPELYFRFLISISLTPFYFLFQYINLHLAYSFLSFRFFFFFIPFHRGIPHIFTSRIYIYNIYHCQEGISYYLGISIQNQKRGVKIRIRLRHIYERVYNNDVFGESNTMV